MLLRTQVAGLFVLFLLPSRAPAQGFVECTRVLHVLEGEAAGDQFGWVSSPVPDVGGDGVQELLVGAPFHDGGGANAGRVYLFDGRTGALRFQVDGAAGQNLGFAVRDAGDLDGDGIGDLIVGGPGSGGVPGIARVLSGANGAEIHALQSGVAGDSFGYSVSGAGDVDEDGVPDFAVGAPLDDLAGANVGRVVVVSGADGVTLLRSLVGVAAGDTFGTAVALLGDVTGDARSELAVGAANASTTRRGRAYVHDLASDVRLYTVAPDASGAEFGHYFVASAGEIDGDGFPDLYVGDYADGNGRGKAYLFSGASGVRLRTFTGGAGDGFGIGRPLGDLDGDGRTEIVLCSYTDSGGAAGAGKAEVFAGSNGQRLRTVTSTIAGEQLGFDAHGIGDADGDGTPDMVLTAAAWAAGRGRVYVVAREPVAVLGEGVEGSDGIVPLLALAGCPEVGTPVTFEVTNGLGGAVGTLLLTAQRRNSPFRGGRLHSDPPILRFPHQLLGSPGAPGEGVVSIPLTIPLDSALAGVTFTARALYLDSGGPRLVSLTPVVRIDVF